MKIWPPASPVCAAVVVRAVKRILVVDDDQIICDFMADVLRDEGWSVTIAHNGAEALIQMG